HYDPLVSAHCVAYVTMLYKLMHHQGELSNQEYKQYLDASYQAGRKIFDERKEEYEAVYDHEKFGGITLDQQLTIWDNQMFKAIYGKNKNNQQEFKTWEDLELIYPNSNRGGDGSRLDSIKNYDNIGMSHRALSAGFFGLKKLRQYTLQDGLNKQEALSKVCIEMMAQGGDADTNGTIVGSLCGAYVGYHEIPQNLVQGLGAGDRVDRLGNVKDQAGGFLEIREQALLQEISDISQKKISSSLISQISTNEDSQNLYTLVKPSYSEQLVNIRTKKDANGVERGLAFRYLNPRKETGVEAINTKIADNLFEAMNSAGVDKQFVLRAIRIANKYGGLSNFFDDQGKRVTDQEQILSIINSSNQASGEGNLNKEQFQQMMRLSFYFQNANKKSNILTGRLNGSEVGLRLAYVNDQVIAKFSLKNTSSLMGGNLR
ncbi:MAG: ADP-ribosylglycohydrolase family protein, partial [Alphaproteobacteria bacterium]